MARRSEPGIHYQAYLRTQRGGTGLPYATALAELLAVLGPQARLLDELPARRRCAFAWGGDEDSLALLGARLGYTQALLRVRVEPHAAPEEFTMRARWPVGRMRSGSNDHILSELWVADEPERLEASPHRRSFRFREGESLGGPRRGRRLSPLDARALANLAGVPDGSRVLDPFAGLATIPLACRARGLEAWASDQDEALMPGLAALLPGRSLLASAESLPFADESFAAIVTEPPYHRYDRDGWLHSLPELARVTRLGGAILQLVAEHMREGLRPPDGCREEAAWEVPRHGLACRALLWRKTDVPVRT